MVTCEVLADLVLADHLTDLDADPVGPGQPSGLDAGDDRARGGFSVAARRSSRLRARSAARSGVAAGDQPLAGVVRAGDLGQVLLVEQRQLQRPAAAISFLMAGARSAVIQPMPRQVFQGSIRAEVIMPRSPTMTIRFSPNLSRTPARSR